MSVILKKNPKVKFTDDELLYKDTWSATDIGLAPDATHSMYHLNFGNITHYWLKQAAKKFVRLQSATRSYSTCRGYIRCFNHFDEYLQSLGHPIDEHDINRSYIIGLIQYLTEKKLSPGTRSITLVNLRVFHQMVLLEDWLNWPEKPLVYTSDLPKTVNKQPKFISDYVLAQLKQNLNQLSLWMQHFIIILMETGRRVSEVCSLTFDCLEQDGDGDILLRVYEKKLKRVRLIPISDECCEAIRKQQKLIQSKSTPNQYLFPAQKQGQSPTVTTPHINRELNRIAQEFKIKDINGVIWKFSVHQFRHTIGTQMINSGVPQVMVQHYLGHESPEMTARYAHIHNETMKKAFVEFQEKIVDIRGNIKLDDEKVNAKWLKKNIMSQALPNGLCALPLTQNRCPHANACLTCSYFRTSKQYLPRHKEQLEETEKVIDNAKQQGWQRIVEMNTAVACNLKSIIGTLEQNHE